MVVDVDSHYGSHNYNGINADIAAHKVLFGPRLSVQVNASARSASSWLVRGTSAEATEFPTRILHSSMRSAAAWIIESPDR